MSQVIVVSLGLHNCCDQRVKRETTINKSIYSCAHIFTLSSEELIGAHHGRTVFVFTNDPRDRKTANKTTKPHKPNVISFYYSRFDFICFVLYFSTFLGARTQVRTCVPCVLVAVPLHHKVV